MACQNYRVRCIKLFRTLCSHINCRCMYMHTCMPMNFAQIWATTFLISYTLEINFYLNEIKSKSFSSRAFSLEIYLRFPPIYSLRPNIVHMHELAHRRSSRTLKYNFPKQACMIELRLARAYIPHLITLHYTRYI